MHEANKGRNTSDIQTLEIKRSSTKHTISKIVGEPFHGRYKIDSHAETTISGKNCTIMKYTDRSCDVSPFSEKYTPMKEIPKVLSSTGFTSENGRNYILVFHKALYMPDRRHTLINPKQCRYFREKV